MQIYNYNTLNYGKGMHSGASSDITCHCQLRLSIKVLLDDAKNLALKILHSSLPGLWSSLPWSGPPLSWGLSVRFFLVFDKLSQRVSPQILLCILTRNQGPQQGSPDSTLLNGTINYNTILQLDLFCKPRGRWSDTSCTTFLPPVG